MGVQDLKIGSVVGALRWLGSASAALLSTPPGSAERRARLDELARVVAQVRSLADARPGKFGAEVKLALHVADVLLERIRRSEGAPGCSGGQGEPSRARRVHPRRAVRGPT